MPPETLAKMGPSHKTTSPDRVEIEEVMANVDTSGLANAEARNLKRKEAVTEFLDSDHGYNLDQQGPQTMTLREMILDDLDSYEAWEKS